MVVSESWNVGGANSYDYTAKEFYSYEQGTKWTGKVGLMTTSDYGYAVGESVRTTCLGYKLGIYNGGNCATNDWIYNTISSSRYTWTMTPDFYSSNLAFLVFYPAGFLIHSTVTSSYGIFPVVYLNENVRITGGSGTDSYCLQPQTKNKLDKKLKI